VRFLAKFSFELMIGPVGHRSGGECSSSTVLFVGFATMGTSA
jgi:hypothetical protein